MDYFEKNTAKKIVDLYDQLSQDYCKEREYNEIRSYVSYDYQRSEYARDYARILYSSSFRRLQGKMQIFGIESTAFYRNRLTHSLEVSQIARSIAKTVSWKCSKIKEIYTEEDLYLLDAAALGHDIGHPAFGHKGERVLDEIAQIYKQRFEGNAQNFRVLRKLDRHGSSKEGLNLTYRTLLAINKYIKNEKDGNPKKFMYSDDYNYLNDFRKRKGINNRTLDVQIIEMADDIAYAVHDLEDGLAQGMFSIDEIIHEIKVYNDEKRLITDQERYYTAQEFERIIRAIQEDLDKEKTTNTIQEYLNLLRKRLTSKLTDDFVRSVTYEYNRDYGQDELCMDTSHSLLCYILNKITFKAATRNSSIAFYELKGEIVIKSLFNIYLDEKVNKNYMLLPPDYRPKDGYSIEQQARCVIDYISGMMDTYAIAEYERLTGVQFDMINVTNIPEVIKPTNDEKIL